MICADSQCSKIFEPKTHNQKFCSSECCKRVTNAKLMEKYYENKDRKSGKYRICAVPGCKTKLSRYNIARICAGCQSKEELRRKSSLISILESIKAG